MRTRIASVVVVLCLVSVLAAQGPRTDITGLVTDPSGGALPGVTVTLAGPVNRVTTSDSEGRYLFHGVLPGAYDLTFALAGFNSVTLHTSAIEGRVAQVNAVLSVGALTETITVMPAAPPAAGVAQLRMSERSARLLQVIPAERRDRPSNTETYDRIDENPFRRVGVDPRSTFSVDVDTASYANVRRFLTDGQLPPPGAVRTEELINYFRFDYPQPKPGTPFSITTELADCPWNPRHKLALIGLQGRHPDVDDPSPRNLVFLLDVSGSMMPADKLPLLKQAMRMLVDVLSERDRVAIVVYAGASGIALPSTPGDHKAVIARALAELSAGGSTNGAAGIELAYRVARDNFIPGGVNRVILATDGDFNVGISSQDGLLRLIERERQSGVFLSVLGVGTGNLKDSAMEKLADRGNGNYAYLDSLHEARKVLVHEAGATLTTIAKDVKIQVEFNPAAVGAYRLIGYENRLLRTEDFNDDAKDAGEIGAGHSVTALYEIVPPGVDIDAPSVDPLKYQRPARPVDTAGQKELMTVNVRYKEPDGTTSRLLSVPVVNRVKPTGENLGFASAVAEFGLVLTGSTHQKDASYRAAIARGRTFLGQDRGGYRAEFLRLVERAAELNRRGRGILDRRRIRRQRFHTETRGNGDERGFFS